MMFISSKILQAGEVLAREGKVHSSSAVIIPVPKAVHYPDDWGMRTLVAKEIRSLLEREDIERILAVFGFFDVPRPYIIGGSEIEEKDGTRTDYGFDNKGPFKETFKSRQFRPKHSPLSVERMSPEELLAHIKHPDTFLGSISNHLDRAAHAILKREQEKKVAHSER